MIGARSADEQEFAAFVRGSQRRLRRLAYLVCGDWHRAEDIVQTAARDSQDGTTSVVVNEVDAEFTNRQALAEALGPDFRVRVTEGPPRFATIELVPGSPADKRLPDAYFVESAVEVAPGFTQGDEPCTPPTRPPRRRSADATRFRMAVKCSSRR